MKTTITMSTREQNRAWGRTRIFPPRRGVPRWERVNFGALYSIVCRDIAGGIDRSLLQSSIEDRPEYQALFGPGPLLDVCEGWPVSAVAATGDGPITGGAPTLIMRGWLDPFSARLADVVAAIGAADNVYVVEVPNQSYNVLGYVEMPAHDPERVDRRTGVAPPGHHVPRPDLGNRARTLTAG